jgi:hypothetical protein
MFLIPNPNTFSSQNPNTSDSEIQTPSDHTIHAGTKGPPTMVVYRRLRLVLCGRPQDTMVQAVMQITGDEADDDPQSPGSGNRNIVLPVLPSQEAADAFAAELTRLVSRCWGFWWLSRVEYEENVG